MNSDPTKSPDTLTDAERTDLAKFSSAILAIPAVIGVAGPYIDVYVPDGFAWVSIPVLVVLIGVGIRGIHALAYPSVRGARPFAVRLGALVALMLVAASPEAIRLAVLNYSVKPIWLFTSLGGVLLAVVYLAVAFKSRKTRGQPPDTSLERTRGQ